MAPGIVLILVVVGAYLAAHVATEWLARRYLIVSGAEYLLVGVLIGPQVGGLINSNTVGGFAPFMTLTLGWVGAVVGAQFFLPALIRMPGQLFRVAVSEAALTLILVSGLFVFVLVRMFGMLPSEAIGPAVTLGAVATAAAPSGIAIVAKNATERGPLLRQLQVTTAVDALVAITAFGVLLSILHGEPASAVRPPTETEWVVISIAIGLVGGVLFHLFLGAEADTDRLFIAVAGALILVSGAAAYLQLSPLLPAMLFGIVLVNTSTSREAIVQLLGKVERPLYFVLLIFAGAAWQPSGRGWWVAAVLFLGLRVFAKIGAARLAARLNGALPTLGRRWGVGLLGHGGLAVAIALNYRLHPGSQLPHLVFTAALVSVLVTDLYSARVVQTLVGAYARGGPKTGEARRGERRRGERTA